MINHSPSGAQTAARMLASVLAWRRRLLRTIRAAAAVMLFASLAALLPQAASAQTTWVAPEGVLGWCGAATADTECKYFRTAVEACAYIFADAETHWPNGGLRFIGVRDTDHWYGKICDWKYKIAPGPPGIVFNCANGFHKAGVEQCVSDLEGDLPRACASTPHPISILSGEKFFHRDDYAHLTGVIGLGRSYTSMLARGPRSGSYGVSVTGRPQGLTNWTYDFAFEIQIAKTYDWGMYRAVTLLTPRGDALSFRRQSDGSLKPSNLFRLPQDNYSLVFDGVWPSNLDSLTAASTKWIMTDPEDSKWYMETFADPSDHVFKTARPVRVVTRTGDQVTFEYGSKGELLEIKNGQGAIVAHFSWLFDEESVRPRAVSSVALADGSQVKYSYDSFEDEAYGYPDRMARVDFVSASSQILDSERYYYHDSLANAITGIRDKNGALRWTVEYDAVGRATNSYGPGNVDAYSVSYAAPTTIAFSPVAGYTSGNRKLYARTVTNALGKKATYSFIEDVSGAPLLARVDGQATAGSAPSCAESDTVLSYDTSYHLTSKEKGLTGNFDATVIQPEAKKTVFTRDARGRPTTIVEAEGVGEARTTSITWHTTLNLPVQVKTLGVVQIDYVYTDGRLASKTVTDLTNYTAPYATNGRTRTWTYTWGTTGGSLGKLTSIDGPLAGGGDSVSYGYDAATGFLNSVTNEMGQTTQYTALDMHGAPLTVVDPNGTTTSLAYDTQGRVITATIAPGAEQSLYKFDYDAMENVAKITLPKGGYLQYSYDDGGRVYRMVNDRGETINVSQNQLKETTSLSAQVGGTIYYQQNYAYDELGRLVQQTGGGSQIATMNYDRVDQQTKVTDPRGKVFQTGFDKLGRVVSQSRPQGEMVGYGYDAQDQLTSHTDGRNLQTTRIVDGFGQTIQETSPDRGIRKYWYNNAGKLTKIVDGDNETTNLTYDNEGRLTGENHPAATGENVGYIYDQTTGGNEGLGRLTTITDQSGLSRFTYDAQGRLVTDAKTIQSGTYTVQYAYDANGKVTAITLPSGRIINFTRAVDGLASDISTKASATAAAQDVATSIVYNPLGPVRSFTYGNGLVLTRTYDLNYWLGRTQVMAGGVAKLDLTFGRNENGQPTSVTDNVATVRNAAFTYTDAGRLLTASGVWGADTYSYDLAGNRTSKTRVAGGSTSVEAVTLSPTSNRIDAVKNGSSAVIRTLTYRNGGDVSQDATAGSPAIQYTYNLRKRLVKVQGGTTVYGQYGYDGMNHRVWRTVGSGTGASTTHYIYDPDGHLLAEHDAATGAAIREYVWLDDMPLAVIDRTSGAAQMEFIHTGQLEEPLVLTDSSQAKVWEGFTEPYGATQVTGTATLNLRLPGQELQAETGGLHQNWFRDYDPSLGRYVEADPLGVDAGQNVYGYVDGRPLQYVDRDGRCPICAAVLIGAGIAGAAEAWDQYREHGRICSWASVATQAGIGGAGVAFGFIGGAAFGEASLGIRILYQTYNGAKFGAIGGSVGAVMDGQTGSQGLRRIGLASLGGAFGGATGEVIGSLGQALAGRAGRTVGDVVGSAYAGIGDQSLERSIPSGGAGTAEPCGC